jgi:hypothetical protein
MTNLRKTNKFFVELFSDSSSKTTIKDCEIGSSCFPALGMLSNLKQNDYFKNV